MELKGQAECPTKHTASTRFHLPDRNASLGLRLSHEGAAALSTSGHGHGTHCAGSVGGTIHGVAKSAIIHGVRVLSCTGGGSWAGVIGGINYVKDQKIAHPDWPIVVRTRSAAAPSSAAPPRQIGESDSLCRLPSLG